MEVEGERHELTARTGLELAPGLAHQATNATVDDVEFLVISLPPSHGDRHEVGKTGGEWEVGSDGSA
jgi:hypothetical protein